MDFKKKNILLILSFVILLFLIYKFSVAKTIKYKSNYESLVEEKEKIDNADSRIIQLKKQSTYLDSILERENISVTNSFQQFFFKKINEFKKEEEFHVLEFKEPITIIDNEIKSSIYIVSVQGSFNALLSFLNFIEKESLGEIKSYSFTKKKNYTNNFQYLELKLYLKKIFNNT